MFTREQHVRLEALHEVAMMWSALDVSLLAGVLVMAEIRPLSMCVPSVLLCTTLHFTASLAHLSTAMGGKLSPRVKRRARVYETNTR